MSHYYFCTYFDLNYSDKGLALYESLVSHVSSFTLYILCLDKQVYLLLESLNLPSVILLSLSELETRNPKFLASKDNRSLIEYYFTCTPVFIRDVIGNHSEIDIITYIDADMYLFASIDTVYDEMGSASILIVEHRFPTNLQEKVKFGRFNVGYLSFRNDIQGTDCLEDWAERCIEWCYDRLEGDKYADQKYLDTWDTKYSNLIISDNIGLNVAPWNIMQYKIKSEPNGTFRVDNKPLLVFHFHGIKEKYRSNFLYIFDNTLRKMNGHVLIRDKSLYQLYYQYISHVLHCRQKISMASGNRNIWGNIRTNLSAETKNSSFFRLFIQIIRGRYICDIIPVFSIGTQKILLRGKTR